MTDTPIPDPAAAANCRAALEAIAAKYPDGVVSFQFRGDPWQVTASSPPALREIIRYLTGHADRPTIRVNAATLAVLLMWDEIVPGVSLACTPGMLDIEGRVGVTKVADAILALVTAE